MLSNATDDHRVRSLPLGPPTADRHSSFAVRHLPSTIFNSLSSDPYLWLTLLLSLPVIGPLLQPGYFWGAHDARHSVYFLYQFDKSIQDGVLYPRWSPDFAFGYGYPFFNIYGPLATYMGEAFRLAGLDIVTAVKVVFGLSALCSGLAMYLFVRHLLGQPAGLIAALTYVYIPYHLFDLYVRAAQAESVGFVFMPLVLYGFYEVTTRPRLSVILWSAVAYACLMFTSNLLALLFTPILGLFVATMLLMKRRVGESANGKHAYGYRWTNRELSRFRAQPPLGTLQSAASPWDASVRSLPLGRSTLLRLLTSSFPPAFVLLLGLGLSAIFWLPALLEYRFVRVDQWVGGRFAFGDDFVEIYQLFSPRWGFGASIAGPDDEAGFQIGLTATVLFILSFLVVPKLVDEVVRRALYFFQAITLALLFLTVPISDLVWRFLPLSSFAQFPWRLLVVIAPFISVVAGTIVAEENGQQSIPLRAERSLPLGQVVNPEGKPPNGQWSLLKSLPTSYSLLPTIILSCLILLSSYPYLQAEVRDPKPTEGPVSQAALFRFQQSSDEMTGQTAWVSRIPNWSTLAEQVERGGEITTKVNYTALPADNSVGVYSMEVDSVHELLWVGTEQEGQTVTFFIPYYPGWQAYIYEDLGPHDGNLDEEIGPVTRIGPVVDRPHLSITPIEGWIVVPIPVGSHFLELRFEDTMVRTVGRWISMITILFLVVLLLIDKFVTIRRSR